VSVLRVPLTACLNLHTCGKVIWPFILVHQVLLPPYNLTRYRENRWFVSVTVKLRHNLGCTVLRVPTFLYYCSFSHQKAGLPAGGVPCQCEYLRDILRKWGINTKLPPNSQGINRGMAILAWILEQPHHESQDEQNPIFLALTLQWKAEQWKHAKRRKLMLKEGIVIFNIFTHLSIVVFFEYLSLHQSSSSSSCRPRIILTSEEDVVVVRPCYRKFPRI
jgi:hypothetical protein